MSHCVVCRSVKSIILCVMFVFFYFKCMFHSICCCYCSTCSLFWHLNIFFTEEIPKPPSEPAPIAKDKNLIEDDAPWRRPNSIRLNRTAQPESPPKIRTSHAVPTKLLYTNWNLIFYCRSSWERIECLG